MEGTGRQQDFKHGQIKRTVLNLEISYLIPSKHDNVTKVTRPSFPTRSTEDDPHWGWLGARNCQLLSSLPHLLSFPSLSQTLQCIIICLHTMFLVRAGFVLVAGFASDSGRTSTSDKISNELESLPESIVYEVTMMF